MRTFITPKQRLVAECLAVGQTARQAAKVVGVSYKTISRWQRHMPHFGQYVEELLMRAEEEGNQILRGLRLSAVVKLGELLQHPNPHVALKSVESILTRQRGSELKLGAGLSTPEVDLVKILTVLGVQ